MSEVIPRLIVTHPGGAHTDDFLSCCLLVSTYEVPVERRDPTECDLADIATFVVDVGGRHEAALNNYDHHQFANDQEPVQCALSLVLKHFGLYETAFKHCPWLEVAERMDVHGPNKTSVWMGINRDQLAQLHSPTHFSMVKLFSKQSKLVPDEALYAMMKQIGDDVLNYLKTLEIKIRWFERHAKIHKIEAETGCFFVMQVVREGVVEDDQSLGMFQFIDQYNEVHSDAQIIGTIMPDRRSEGYSLTRFQDHPALDFNRVKGRDGVHFVHASGFVAKTELTKESDLLTLFSEAYEAPESHF